MTTIGPARLQRLRQFEHLGQPLLERLAAVMHQQHCPAGATIFAHNDESREVYVVLRGHLRITAFSHAGREVVFHDLLPGDMVGELSAIDGAPRGGNLVAVTDAELGRIDPGDFNRLRRDMPAFADFMLARVTRLVRSLNRRIQLLAAPVATRVCIELLRLAERQRISENAARLVPAPKHLDLANRLNTHREAVSRTLGLLQRHAVIRRGQGELLVENLAALRAHAEGAPLAAGRGSVRPAKPEKKTDKARPAANRQAGDRSSRVAATPAQKR
jgi:CRP/FNR family transcriptional regulator, cyclic AMP receptor protein